ncbi:hypothetical protein T06_6609 [Trichinella sp. T6]|nr:hypothetical protein T06_6609 [Trichinella sp. T6]
MGKCYNLINMRLYNLHHQAKKNQKLLVERSMHISYPHSTNEISGNSAFPILALIELHHEHHHLYYQILLSYQLEFWNIF